jgi:hypothetical protein
MPGAAPLVLIVAGSDSVSAPPFAHSRALSLQSRC